MHPNKRPQAPVANEFGFRAWKGNPTVMSAAHVHSDMEINFVVSGGMDYFLAGRFLRLLPGQFVVFWAGAPHQMVAHRKQSQTYWVTIPLPWFMQWQLPEQIREHLLAGGILIEKTPELWRESMLAQWAEDFRSSPERQKIAALEIEALLRRLAIRKQYTGSERVQAHAPELVTRIARYIGEHYQELKNLGEIASAMKLHPNYLTQLFNKATGISLWDYVIRLRIAHAQRLLLMSNLSVLEVALESGFCSISRFHAAFKRLCQSTPRQFRQRPGPVGSGEPKTRQSP